MAVSAAIDLLLMAGFFLSAEVECEVVPVGLWEEWALENEGGSCLIYQAFCASVVPVGLGVVMLIGTTKGTRSLQASGWERGLACDHALQLKVSFLTSIA